MAEESGPEKYAPSNRRAPEKGSDAERIAFLRQQQSQANPPIRQPPKNSMQRSGASPARRWRKLTGSFARWKACAT